ncbi:hypothetical protein BKA69DRAFT_1036896 [Paraphysoderma sedebokerense]|nr:hypothetical protein BKA69DRAFT_1036896 [Paraphysoderma sedebokerense]
MDSEQPTKFRHLRHKPAAISHPFRYVDNSIPRSTTASTPQNQSGLFSNVTTEKGQPEDQDPLDQPHRFPLPLRKHENQFNLDVPYGTSAGGLYKQDSDISPGPTYNLKHGREDDLVGHKHESYGGYGAPEGEVLKNVEPGSIRRGTGLVDTSGMGEMLLGVDVDYMDMNVEGEEGESLGGSFASHVGLEEK